MRRSPVFSATVIALVLLLSGYAPTTAFAASAPPTDETAATEAWFVDARLDPIANQMRQEAKIVNEDGFSLTVFKHFNGTVWADFVLPSYRPENLHRRRLPTFIVDSNAPHDLSRLSEFGSSLYRTQTKEIRLQMYASPGQPQQGLLREIMVGDRLVVRYYDALGKTHSTDFSLLGSDDAVALAMGVEPIGEPSTRDRDGRGKDKATRQWKEPQNSTVAFDRYVDEQMERCQSLKQKGDRDAFRACQRTFALCVERAEQTASQLKQCFQAKSRPSS
ncbi:MAG: hypothetical protein NXI16_01855 [Alphaproteobacteria bacterium]|nr:hypothetical protein [Alphaproteobacteria bacterium]